MLFGMTAKTDEHEKPPFETPVASPFDPLRVSLGKPFETQGKQGPLTGASKSGPRNFFCCGVRLRAGRGRRA